MKKYYEDSLVTIYHANCIDALPVIGEVDCIVTDPPYGIDGGNGGTSKLRGKGNYSSDFDDTPEYIQSVVIKALFNIAKWKTLVVTSGWKNLTLYPSPDGFGCFYSPSACGMHRFGYTDAQPILYYGWHYLQGKKPEAASYKMTESPEKNGHPCPKPEKAWSWLVQKVATKDMVVLDPFMGSGTTMRVCKDNGIKSIGIEMNEKYCEIAAKRMSQEVFVF